MLIGNQTVKLNVASCKSEVKDYYLNLGYDVSEKIIEIKAEDLWKYSHIKVKVECDYCGKVFLMPYKDYVRAISCRVQKVSCNGLCSKQKRKEGNLNTYGVEEVLMLEEVQNKRKLTCVNKYGGVSPMSSDTVKQKHRQTFKKRYGKENPSQIEEFQNKKAVSKYLNNSCNISKEQIRLAKLFDGEMNFPIGKYNVDILLNNNVILEYDGDGHNVAVKYNLQSEEEFLEIEKIRTKFLLDNDYKIIRFVNNFWWKSISDEEYLAIMKKCMEHLDLFSVISYEFNKENSQIQLFKRSDFE